MERENILMLAEIAAKTQVGKTILMLGGTTMDCHGSRENILMWEVIATEHGNKKQIMK